MLIHVKALAFNFDEIFSAAGAFTSAIQDCVQVGIKVEIFSIIICFCSAVENFLIVRLALSLTLVVDNYAKLIFALTAILGSLEVLHADVIFNIRGADQAVRRQGIAGYAVLTLGPILIVVIAFVHCQEAGFGFGKRVVPLACIAVKAFQVVVHAVVGRDNANILEEAETFIAVAAGGPFTQLNAGGDHQLLADHVTLAIELKAEALDAFVA